MPSEDPLITIGITCYNAEKTILRALKSASEQSWPNIEIIVVDDGSNDDSTDLVKQCANEDARVRLIEHKVNKGYPSALNTIINNSCGEYIAFFDDDDISNSNRLFEQYKRLLSFFETSGKADVLCYTHRRVFVNGLEKKDAYVTAIGHKSTEPHGEMVADYLLWQNKRKGYVWGEFGSGTLMAKKQLLKKFGLDSSFRRSAEWDLAIRVALQGGYFISVDQPLVEQHKTYTQDKSGTLPLQYTLKLRMKHKTYLKKKTVYYGAIFQAYARFYYFRNEKWKGRIYFIMSCLMSPSKILRSEIRKRI